MAVYVCIGFKVNLKLLEEKDLSVYWVYQTMCTLHGRKWMDWYASMGMELMYVCICFQVNPKLLVEKDISVSRTIQTQGEFVVVFSNAYTSMISCGYNICESIHYALPDWIPLGTKAAKVTYSSSEGLIVIP